jgi:hypothetical protein
MADFNYNYEGSLINKYIGYYAYPIRDFKTYKDRLYLAAGRECFAYSFTEKDC